MKENSTDEKDIKKLADNFNSIKPPETVFNTKARLDYYKDRKQKESDLSKELLEKIKLKYIGKFLGIYDVYEVDGNLIRTKVDIDFVSGGNAGRYSYVPEKELWIDSNLLPNDLVAILIHEFVECIIMKYNGKSYEDAHDKASTIESKFREKHLKDDGKSIKIELEKANDFIINFLKKQKTPKD